MSRDKTTIIFHNGTHTIGGTLIEIAYNDSHVFFDCGTDYNPARSEQANSLRALLADGSAPWVEQLYDRRIALDDRPVDNAISLADTAHWAVFLSHAHLDHSKLINAVNPHIPVYASDATRALLIALNRENDYLIPLTATQQAPCEQGQDHQFTRPIDALPFGRVQRIGEIAVTLYPVDHDAYGASGLMITTPDASIAYSGDIRLHGYRPADSKAFCSLAKHCDLLLMEGVSISNYEVGSPLEEVRMTTEAAVVEQVVAAVREAKGRATTFNYYIANIERICHLLDAVAGLRQVVLEAHHASVLKAVADVDVHYYCLDARDYHLDEALRIDIADLVVDQSNFFWQLVPAAFQYREQMPKGGVYIHSDAQPLGPFDPSYEPFFQAFADAEFEVKNIGCSGHAYTTDLVRLIDDIQPKCLCPIHSFKPERLFNLHGGRLLPKKGQVITI